MIRMVSRTTANLVGAILFGLTAYMVSFFDFRITFFFAILIMMGLTDQLFSNNMETLLDWWVQLLQMPFMFVFLIYEMAIDLVNVSTDTKTTIYKVLRWTLLIPVFPIVLIGLFLSISYLEDERPHKCRSRFCSCRMTVKA